MKQFIKESVSTLSSRRLEIGLQYFPILFIVALFPSIFLEKSSTATLGILMQWLFIKSFSLLFTFFLWRLAKELFRKIEIETTFVWLSAIGAIGAGISGALVHRLALLFGLNDFISIQKRILGAIIVGGLWLPIYSLVIQNFGSYRQIEEELLADLDRQEQIRFKQSSFFYLVRAKAQESIQERLRVTALESQLMLQKYMADGKEDERLPEIVRDLASGTFRNLSHELIEKSQSLQNKEGSSSSRTQRGKVGSFISLAALSGRNEVLNPLVFAFLTSFFTLGILLRHESIIASFAIAIFDFVSAYIVLRLCQWVFARYESLRTSVVQVGIIFIMFATPPISSLLMNLLGIQSFDNGYKRYPWLFATLVLVTAIALNIGQATLISNRQIRDALKSKIQKQAAEEQVLSKEIIDISQIWAKHIHGQLQSNLIVQAKILQNAQESQDADAIQASILQIMGILRNPEIGLETATSPLSEELAKRRNLWSALVKVSLNQKIADSELRPSEVKAIGECVEELIANSVRHGRASELTIDVSRGSDLKIIVSSTDNGLGIESASPGLGFHLFDYLSGGAWYTEKSDKTGMTTVRIAIDSSILVDEESPGSPRQ